ncbi:MAG TPA: hypothetical protein VFR07_15905 [Mycobacteriales bacterium]|nr:hypothetical protein [Mycobacteriales bacterium]
MLQLVAAGRGGFDEDDTAIDELLVELVDIVQHRWASSPGSSGPLSSWLSSCPRACSATASTGWSRQ